MDREYAAMVMDNGARMEGVEADMFFTFFGLAAIAKNKMTDLHQPAVGKPSFPFPAMIGGLPRMEVLVTCQMKKEMERIDMPPVDEFTEMISLSGGKIYACKLALHMFKLKEEDMFKSLDGVLTIGDFYARAAGEATHIIFI